MKLNKKGLPIRPGEPVCGFYAKKGECRYGACAYGMLSVRRKPNMHAVSHR